MVNHEPQLERGYGGYVGGDGQKQGDRGVYGAAMR